MPVLFTRKPLRFPGGNDFEATEAGRLESLAAEASRRWSLPTASPCAFADWLRNSDRRSGLEHPLSDHWVARRSPGEAGQRGGCDPLAELGFVRAAKPALLRSLESGDSRIFSGALERACALATGAQSVSLRTGEARLRADNDGTTAAFCDWTLVPTLLARLQRDILDSVLQPAAKSIAAMVGLLNIHPFRDGNGRCARLLFHAVFDRHHPTGAVFPLRSLFECSAGGFELSMREAEINDRWGELVHYFEAAFEILAGFETGPSN